MTARTFFSLIFASSLAPVFAQDLSSPMYVVSVEPARVCHYDLGESNTSVPRQSLAFLPINPNPAKGELNFCWTQPDANQAVSINIADVQSKMSLTLFVEESQAGLNHKVISLTAFDSGIYNLCLSVDGQRFEQQILVVK